MKKSYIILYVITTFSLSYGLGLLFDDQYLLGSTTLFFGFIQTLLMTKGKWYEEFVGLIETICSTIVCVLSCLYGSAIFTVLIFIPISIFSIVNWKKNEHDGEVTLNKMTVKKSALVLTLIVASTCLISWLISLIPNQNLPFFDTLVNILDIAGILLIALRYKEGWILWILCNIVELTMWIILEMDGVNNNSIMMIITAVIFLALNIWGFVSFLKLRKKQETIQKID